MHRIERRKRCAHVGNAIEGVRESETAGGASGGKQDEVEES